MGLALHLVVTDGFAQSAGRFNLEGSVIASGGGAGRANRFSLEGTIGQSIAGSSATKRFQLEGGFWTSVTVQQSPAAPQLKIAVLPGGWVRLSWPVEATGFKLEECADLAANVWTDTELEALVSETEFSVTVNGAGNIRCYRLKR